MSNMLGHTCRWIRRLAMVLTFAGLAAVPQTPALGQQQQQIHRVCATSCGWGGAVSNLRTALAAAQPGDQIWVAVGTYIPTGCTGVHPLECSFELKAGVELYGNFCGTETGNDLSIRDALDGDCITILDGQSNDGRVLHVVRADEEGLNYIDGFTIQNGHARGWSETQDGAPYPLPTNGNAGGGMLVTDGDTAIIMCTFVGNAAGGSICWFVEESYDPPCYGFETFQGLGGGLAFIQGSALPTKATIQNCVFTGNLAMRGTWPDSLDQTSGPQGGGIYKSAGFGPLTIMNSVFTDNVVDASEPGSCSLCSIPFPTFSWRASGGAFAQGLESCGATVFGSITQMWNCTLYGNDLIATSAANATGAGIFAGLLGVGESASRMEVRNTIVHENTPVMIGTLQNQIFDLICLDKTPMDVRNSNVQGEWTGSGADNIDLPPLFADASNGNFRLTANSPCINTGTKDGLPTDIYDIAKTNLSQLYVPDLDLRVRVVDCDVDMGAFEYQSTATTVGLADLNGDCCVDFDDLLILLSSWGQCPASACPADFNNDGEVNFEDLLVLINAFSDGCDSGVLPFSTVDDCFERIGLSNIEALAACIEAMISEE